MILAFQPGSKSDKADAELVQQSLQGTLDERHAAYTVLVSRYQGFVRAMLLGLTRQPALADDLTQDTFLIAWQKLNTLTAPEKFAGWLKQLAYREFLHNYRRRQTEHKHRPQAMEPDTETPNQADVDAQLLQLLVLCTPLEREIMVLSYGFEFTLREIAESRGMPVGTVKSHVYRAKTKMQRWLETEAASVANRGDKNHG
ncbi:MAG: RNA polymerase sigma factor [bacterium]